MNFSWDYFFYAGVINQDKELEYDIWFGTMQPTRSMFYNRRDSAELDMIENKPNSLGIAIIAPYSITNWAAYRNSYVASNTKREMRVALSQSTIQITQNGDQLDIAINYLPFYKISKVQQVRVPTQFGGI